MEGWREGFHQKGKIYQQDLFSSWCITGRLFKLLAVIVIKLHNTCNSQLASSIVFPKLFCSQLLANIKEVSHDLCSLAFCSIFETVLICVSLTNCNLLQQSLILLCLHFGKKKKTYNNHVKRHKYGSINSPDCPALWFVYALMHSREEWVLVYLGSQHKRMERIFPFVMTMVYPTLKKYCFLNVELAEVQAGQIFARFFEGDNQ